MSINTELPLSIGSEKGRLVYSSDSEVIPGPTFEGLESLRERDPLLYADAVELAHNPSSLVPRGVADSDEIRWL